MAKKKKKATTTYAATSTIVGTGAPTGMSLSRSGNRMTASWNIGDESYGGGQIVRWYVNGACVWNNYVDPSATSASYDINPDNPISSVVVGVLGKKPDFTTQSSTTTGKGDKKKTVVTTNYFYTAFSAESQAVFTFVKPSTPTVSFAIADAGINQGTFSWSVNADDTGNNMFRKFDWETIRVDNWNSYSPPSNWRNATKGSLYSTSGTKTITESTLANENASFTRWFRVRAVGPGGTTKWVYSYHVYAMPQEAKNVTANVVRRSGNAGYTCRVKWNAPNSFARPINTASVSYAMAVPSTTKTTQSDKVITSLTYPAASSPSWTSVNTVIDTSSTDSLAFTIPQLPNLDEVLWVRVDTKYDSHTTYGIPVLAKGDSFVLKPPTITAIETYAATRRASITLENESSLTYSVTAVYFRTEDNPSNYQRVGIITKAESGNAVTIQLPDWGSNAVSLGFQTMVTDYTPATRPSLGTVASYILTDTKMQSDIVWEEGAIPIPPKNVLLTNPSPTEITVDWDWTWESADHAELSWSQNENAWESTQQPSTYVLSDVYNPLWTIANLDVGTWCVKVRLGKRVSGSDNISWSVHSALRKIKLSSAPATPSLVLSQGAATLDDTITCYWAYISTDGTAQMQADVCEATFNAQTETFEYGAPFASTGTVQHLSFDVADRGWQTGTVHYIALRVLSASGEQSVGWSVPVALTIVEPITCSIIDSSLSDMTFTGEGYTLATYENCVVVSYVVTSDTDVAADKTYYTSEGEVVASPKKYGYTEVAEPTGNPSTSGYYEYVFDDETETYSYVASEDTSVVEGKTYYTQSNLMSTYYEQVVALDPNITFYDEEGDEISSPTLDDIDEYYVAAERTVLALTEMPMTIEVDGAGPGSTTTIIIERSQDFKMRRPDESTLDGYEGETILSKTFDNDGEFTITNDDLIGHLDDRAPYRIIAIAQDSFGQTAEASLEFEVHWEHQAIVPDATATIDVDYDVAILEPKLPAGATVTEGDVCDIYRLSIDAPQLIYEGAEFGEKYVDEYPTIGIHGGYRFVYRTYNNDYTTANNRIAWYNTTEHDNEILDREAVIINFDGNQVALPYGFSVDTSWQKDFTETKYLGGSIQGDWNPAVSRTSNIQATVFDGDELDDDTVSMLRKLAVYAGICHVRTPEGSSYAANVDVSESRETRGFNIVPKYTLSVTRVDSQALDGITYDQWLEKRVEEEEEEEE